MNNQKVKTWEIGRIRQKNNRNDTKSSKAWNEIVDKIFCAVSYIEKANEDWIRGKITPIEKKEDTRFCCNYKDITLLSTASKIYASNKQTRLETLVDKKLHD